MSLRFSAYGVVAVGALLFTGAVNTWYLAGSIRALTETDYGHLLLIKITCFLSCLGSRRSIDFGLHRHLLRRRPRAVARAFRHLRRNVAIEIGAGAVILSLVAVLGVTPPGLGE